MSIKPIVLFQDRRKRWFSGNPTFLLPFQFHIVSSYNYYLSFTPKRTLCLLRFSFKVMISLQIFWHVCVVLVILLSILFLIDSPIVTSKTDNIFRGIEGAIVTAHCTAIGNPLVSPFFGWTGPNGNINSTDKYVLEESIDRHDAVRGTIATGRLTIMDFVPDDVGTYSCTVTNNYGEDSHNLEIKEASKWFRRR